MAINLMRPPIITEAGVFTDWDAYALHAGLPVSCVSKQIDFAFRKETEMPSTYSGDCCQFIKAHRIAYAQKLRKLGIIENSNKWRTLMCRKGL